MSTISELDEQQRLFIDSFLPTTSCDSDPKAHSERPYVTLTYACSLDGQISLAPGVRTTLSGPETKSMTHYLRLHHDAILVGAGTAVADDPSLNCRYPGADLAQQPQPVIVDPNLRWKPDNAAALQLASQGKGKKPWIICNSMSNAQSSSAQPADTVYMPVAQTTTGHIEWNMMLKTLKAKGLNSIMIEGGATIMNALLVQPELVDTVIVTLAPTWLGQGGVHVSPPAQETGSVRHNAATLKDTVWKQFGADVVLCGRLIKR